MTNTFLIAQTETGTFKQSDGYASHYRQWGAPDADEVIVILHGGVSHSLWQAPLAEAIVDSSDLGVVALDRRGSGLNQDSRGHLPSKEREIEDVVSVVRSLAGAHRRVHLAGWCFGAQIACIAAAELAGEDVISSLLMIAPGFVFGERYGDVLRLSMQAVAQTVEELGITPDPLHAFVPVPLQSTDFTLDEKWLRFAEDDELKLRRVTQSTVAVWSELAAWSHTALSGLGGVPTLAVFGTKDRLVDHRRVAELLTERVTGTAPVIECLDAPHAVQFEVPEALAESLVRFTRKV
ncbi:MAG: alpha/beta hydrolase [Dermatophilaceae bacterium]